MLAVWLARLWLGWAAVANAAPVELPATEDPGHWRTALALSGLERATVGSGPGVKLTESGDHLLIWVRDVHGAEHRLAVPLPETPREREAVAALAASLVQPMKPPPVALPALPPLPARQEPPKTQEPPGAIAQRLPQAERVEDPPVQPSVAMAEPVLIDVLIERPGLVRFDPLQRAPLSPPSEPAVPGSVAPERPRLGQPFLALGPSLRMRPTLRSTAAAGLLVGVARGPYAVAVGLEGVLPARLLQLDIQRWLTVVDARLLPAVTWRDWEVGPVLGLSGRFTDDPFLPIPPAMLPTAGVTLSRLLRLQGVTLRPSLLVEVDLVPTRLPVGDEPVGPRLQPVSAGLGVAWVMGRR